MEPIHEAALDGDVAAIDRLVAEDGRRLNAQIQGDFAWLGGRRVAGCTPLMLAAWWGHDAAVARLLALGADVGLKDAKGETAAHLACIGGDYSSVLALLLDAGASFEARTRSSGWTPLSAAASFGDAGCVALLLDRGGDARDVNEQDDYGGAALHLAASEGSTHVLQMLLQAGADPTIRNKQGRPPRDEACSFRKWHCIPNLKAALMEPQRTRALFKARAPTDIRRTVTAAAAALASKGLPAVLHRPIIAMALPSYLAGRVAQAQELPRVSIQCGDERLAACVKYALGLEGRGGVVFEGQEPTVGMLPEVLVELLELLMPKWDPARKGRVLGDGYIEVPEEEEGETYGDDYSDLYHEEDMEYDSDVDKFGNY